MTLKSKIMRLTKGMATLAFLSTVSVSVATPITALMESPHIAYASSRPSYKDAIKKAKDISSKAKDTAKSGGSYDGKNVLDDVKGTINAMDGVKDKEKVVDKVTTLVDQFNSNVNVVNGLIDDMESNKDPQKAFSRLFGDSVSPQNIDDSKISGELKKLTDSANAIDSQMKTLKEQASKKSDGKDDTKDAPKESDTNNKSSSSKQTNGVASWQTILGNITIGKEMVAPNSPYYGNTYEKQKDLMGWAKSFASSSNSQNISYNEIGKEARALTTGSTDSIAEQQGGVLGAYIKAMQRFGYCDNGNTFTTIGRRGAGWLLLLANDASDGVQTIFDAVAQTLVNLNPMKWLGFEDKTGSKEIKLTNSDGKAWIDGKGKDASKHLQDGFTNFFKDMGITKQLMDALYSLFIFITLTGLGFSAIWALSRHASEPLRALQSTKKWLVRFMVIPIMLLSASAVGALTQGIGSTLKPVGGDTTGIASTLINMEGWAVAENFSPNMDLKSQTDATDVLRPSSKQNADLIYQANVRGYLALHEKATDANMQAWHEGRLSGNMEHDMESELLKDWGSENFTVSDYVSGISNADSNGWSGFLSASRVNSDLTNKSMTARQYADGSDQFGILTNSAQENKDKTYVNMDALDRYVWGIQPYLIGDGADNNKRIAPQSTIETRILKASSHASSVKGSLTYRMTPDLAGTGGYGLSNQSMVTLLSSTLSPSNLHAYFYNIPRGTKEGEGQTGMQPNPNKWQTVTQPSTGAFEGSISVLNMLVCTLSKTIILIASLITVIMSGLVGMVIDVFRRLMDVLVYGRWESAAALIVYNVCVCFMIAFATLVPSILMQVITGIGSFGLTALSGAPVAGKILQMILVGCMTAFVIAPTRGK